MGERGEQRAARIGGGLLILSLAGTAASWAWGTAMAHRTIAVATGKTPLLRITPWQLLV